MDYYPSLLLKHPVLMGGEGASGNRELLHHHGDVSCVQGPPLARQLGEEVWCWASVLDGGVTGEWGAAAPRVCHSLPYSASGQSLWSGLQTLSQVSEFSC